MATLPTCGGRNVTAEALRAFMASNFLPRPPWGDECADAVVVGSFEDENPRASNASRRFWGDDGAKRLCAPNATLASHAPCRVVSIGSNGDASFEKAVHRLAPHCTIDTWDGTLTGSRLRLRKGLPRFISFHASNMDDATWQFYAGRVPHVNVLKIDCEGCEFSALPPFLAHVCVQQIHLELHGCACNHCVRPHHNVSRCSARTMGQGEAWWRYARVHSLLTLLSGEYRFYSAVPNTRFSDGTCVEYALERRVPCRGLARESAWQA
jgi:hypothetical protein